MISMEIARGLLVDGLLSVHEVQNIRLSIKSASSIIGLRHKLRKLTGDLTNQHW
jgi:hypothetical protein